MATPKVLFGCGDSIGGFHGDTGSTPVGQGLIQRLAWGGDGSNVLACFNMSKASSTVLHFNESTNNILDYWCQFATVFLGQRIINDFGVNPGNLITVATGISRIQTSISIARGRGIKKFIQFLPGPATTSASTNWLNDADQTPQAGFAAGGRIWDFRAEVYKLVGEGGVDLVCPMTAFQSPTNKYVWKSDGTNDKYTADGTHPSALGHTEGAAEARTYVDALVMDDTLTASIGLELSHRNPETDLLESNPISDSSPNPFTIPAVTGAALSTSITSSNITPTGYTSAPVSVSADAEYSIDDGDFTSTAGAITYPSTVKVRVTSSGSNSTGVTGTLTIGDKSADFVVTTIASGATLIGSADFSDGELLPTAFYAGTSWGQGVQSGASTVIEDGAYKISMPITDGSVYSWLNFNVPPDTTELYIQFRAKMPDAKNGLKFVKVFGDRIGDNYANCTFNLDYTGAESGSGLRKGDLDSLIFGDGSIIGNDAGNVIYLSGANSPSTWGRAPSPSVLTPEGKAFTVVDWSDTWHEFKLYVKFNDGTTALDEVPNGAFYIEIDGDVYVNATGLFNRHYSNLPVEYISFGNYSQGGGPAFNLYFDDIKISTGGFSS